MQKIQAYRELIEAEIAQIRIPQEPERLYTPIRYLLGLGGKRMRPVLSMLAAELFGADPKKALNPGLAIEFFHNFSLIHDDIMDEAPLRRGFETVHQKWNGKVALLSGDALFVVAYQYLARNESKYINPLLHLFSVTVMEVCEGQQMDMDFEERNDVTIPEYIEMIRLKTSVLLGGALEMGAIVADASDEDRKHIYLFGQHIGIAFQLQDDILDLYGDPEKFGKQIGGDVIAKQKNFFGY
jgi:geranylgeranyl diphosphate synthase, type II